MRSPKPLCSLLLRIAALSRESNCSFLAGRRRFSRSWSNQARRGALARKSFPSNGADGEGDDIVHAHNFFYHEAFCKANPDHAAVVAGLMVHSFLELVEGEGNL
jgi:hypothetical protein